MYSREYRTYKQPAAEPSRTNQFAPKPFKIQPRYSPSSDNTGDIEQQEAGTMASEGVSQVNASQNLLVQRKLYFNKDIEWLNAENNPPLAEKFTVLADIQKEANSLLKGIDLEVKTGKPKGGVAKYSPQPLPGEVVIEPMPKDSEAEIKSLAGLEVSDRVIALTHELRHVCDGFQKDDRQLKVGVRNMAPWEDLIHSEWRSHASQAKAAYEIFQKTGKDSLPSRHYELIKAWNKDTFSITQKKTDQSMFQNTLSYIYLYSGEAPTEKEVEAFIKVHQNWVEEAFKICPPLDLNL